MEDVHQSFLRDLVSWLRNRAEEAAKESRSEADDAGFQAGRATAYVEVLGHMQAQADLFLLEKEGVGLDAFEAYDLLSARDGDERDGTR